MNQDLDKLMRVHIEAILNNPTPTVGELELVRKYLNDSTGRAFDQGLQPIDPATTAQQLYGIEYDERPITANQATQGGDQ